MAAQNSGIVLQKMSLSTCVLIGAVDGQSRSLTCGSDAAWTRATDGTATIRLPSTTARKRDLRREWRRSVVRSWFMSRTLRQG